ncbi:MAG: RloB family protein [Thermoguttaceae bacterium]
MSKATVALIEQLQRRRGVRNLAKRCLIVCEDTKSARDYFDALKEHFKLSAASVRVTGSGGHTQPIQVVERAIQIKASAAGRNSGTVPFEQVWCVIDGDYGEKIVNARSKAEANGVCLAVSTMCFEYWVLLHFEENDKSTVDCDAVVSTLKRKHLPRYAKGKFDFSSIVVHVRDACERAEKLRAPRIARGDLPENQNPCSEVYKLVNAIDPHLGELPVPIASRMAPRGQGVA